MRIGFFTGSALSIGGGRTLVVPLAKALQRRGHEPVILDVARLTRSRGCVEGIVVWREPLLAPLSHSPGRVITALKEHRQLCGAGGHPFYFLLLGLVQLRFAHTCQLQVLYTCHNMNVLGPLYWGIPSNLVFVMNLIGFGIDPSRGGDLDTFEYQRLAFERPRWDLQVTATDFEDSAYRTVYRELGLPTSKLALLPHCYDDSLFSPSSLSQRQQLRARFFGDAQVALLYPVNVYRRKNVELALDVLALLRSHGTVRLLISGRTLDHGYAAELRERAAALAVTDMVSFLGGVEQSVMPLLYNAADATLFVSHQETFGHGLIESLGCGTPVVGPGWIPACHEILSMSPGGWAPEKDADRICGSVLEARDMQPSERGEVASYAYKRFGSTEISSRFEERVGDLIAAKAGSTEKLGEIDWRGLYGNPELRV